MPNPATYSAHTITAIPLAALTASSLNVRKHGAKDIAGLAAMIRAHGLLQPLITRRTGGSYEVIAGARRLKALQLLARESGDEADVPCVVLGDCDDARAIEASLAENISRLPMDEMDQYSAFAALIRQGRSEEEIAGQFGITLLIVKRRLALARLIPDIHRLYRSGEIDAETLKLLTLAPRERQKAYVALLRDPAQNAPPRWQLKAWLLGGAEIDTRRALFDEARYDGDINGDLFGDARYFLDAEQFWRLQNEAIAALKGDLESKGWAGVHVIGPEQPFYPHQWQEVRKADGGLVVVEVKASGAVEVHKGLLGIEEARKVQRSRARAEATGLRPDTLGGDVADANEAPTEAVSERPELSVPLANYVDLVRLSTVRAALLKHPKVALRVVALRFLAASEHVTVGREPMQAAASATHTTVKGLASEATVGEARIAVRELLGLGDDDPLIGSGSVDNRAAALFAKLLGLSDAHVMQIVALAAAETLALGSDLIDTLGAALKADCRKVWTPDPALFDLIRDREVTTAMLTEVIGETAARSYLTDTGRKKKDIICKALAGEGRQKVSDWQPIWMAFPQGSYTERPMTARPPAEA